MESDDYLLDWKRGGVGYRYVHLLTETEIDQLARAANLQIIHQFYADNDLNLFSILQFRLNLQFLISKPKSEIPSSPFPNQES